MKTLSFLYLLLLSSTIFAQSYELKHDWKISDDGYLVQFISNKIAPPPFSTEGEPAAIMTVTVTNLVSKKNFLQPIVNNELEKIRMQFSIVEYLEKDYVANDNIVSYTEKIGSIKVAVIKYRTNGMRGLTMLSKKYDGYVSKLPIKNVKEVLFIKDKKLFISSLIVLYPDDIENQRSDQLTYLKYIMDR